MASFKISNPFQYFTDASGAPLDAGYVYIGTAGLNPETNPIAVYWDSAMTIPAAQPIRTVGGYLSRNGKVAQLYSASATYSIMVRDKRSALVFSDVNISDLLSSGYVSYGSTTVEKALDAHRVDSMSALISGTWTGINEIVVLSFYGGWAATTAGPKGSSKWHRDGTTGGTPTTNTTAAIQASMATGRIICADGKGWVLSDQEYNYYQFGAELDGLTNDTAAFNSAFAWADVINHVGGPVTAIVSGIVISSSVVAHADKLVTLSNYGISTDQSMISIASNDVRIKGFNIHNYNTALTNPVVKIDGDAERSRISWRDNWIVNDANCPAFMVEELVYDFTFRDNIIESPLNPADDNSRNLHFAQSNQGVTSTRRITIRDNKFRYGSYGCDFIGTGSPNGPIYIRDNEFLGQDTTALHLYHCRRWEATGNQFVNCSARARNNNDNGVVFLDTLSPVTLATSGKFNSNTFVNSTGNAIYVEECIGLEIAGNNILVVSQRTSDTYTYDWTIGTTTATVTSNGGAGILVAGGCQRLNIHDNYIQQARKGIVINRALGAHPEYEVNNISIRGGHITRCAEGGIFIMEKADVIEIEDIAIFNNGGFGDSAAIVRDRQNGDATNYSTNITIRNVNTTPDPSLTNNQARGFYDKYNVGYKAIIDDNNWFVSGTLSAITAFSLSGRIANNDFANGGISLTTPSASLYVSGNSADATSTTTDLTAIGNAINTTGKFTGKVVRNLTTGVLVIAAGAAAGSVWLNWDGTTLHTPV